MEYAKNLRRTTVIEKDDEKRKAINASNSELTLHAPEPLRVEFY